MEELRADAAEVVLPLVQSWPAAHRPAGIRLLAFSPGAEVARALIAWVRQWVQPERRVRRLPRTDPPPRPSIPDTLPYVAILQSLKRHPSAETETFLRSAAPTGTRPSGCRPWPVSAGGNRSTELPCSSC